MPSRAINLIVIHCSATPNGVALGSRQRLRNAAQVIDGWHKQRGFRRMPSWRLKWNQALESIGYHAVIETNGFQYTGRHRDEVGAHVAGHNIDSLGICCVGYDKLTLEQWKQLRDTVSGFQREYPNARVVGHRDLSPDLNHDGRIEPNEYMKLCPGWNVADWISGGMQPLADHTVEEKQA